MKKILSLFIAMLMILGLVACTTDGGAMSVYRAEIGGKKYEVQVLDQQGYSIAKHYEDADKFCIYQSGECLVEDGMLTSGIATTMAEELIKREGSEYKNTKGKVTYYAFEQYDTQTPEFTVLIKNESKPSYIMFTMKGSRDKVIDLLEVMSVE